MTSQKNLDISWGAIFKVSFTFFVFYVIYLIKDILILIGFSLIISILFNPLINILKRKGFSRFLATILVYTVFFVLLSFFIFLIAKALVSEGQRFGQAFNEYFLKIAPPLKSLGFKAFESMDVFTRKLQDWLVSISSSIFGAVITFFGGVFSTFTIFVLAIFFSLEEKGIDRMIQLFFPKKYENYFLNLFEKSQQKISGWFGGRVLSCIFVGFLTFLAGYIFKIKYAATFGVLGGILDIIPFIGPIVAGVILFAVAALDNFLKGIFILVTFFLIHQIEGYILTPFLTKKFIGLPPLLVLISLMIGGKLWGVLGAILVIPFVGIIYEFSKEFLIEKKNQKNSLASFSLAEENLKKAKNG